MRIALTHTFACTPARFFEAIEDPAFEELQSREGDMRRDIVEQRVNPDGTRYRRIRCRPNRTIPAFLKPLVGPEIVYFQTNEIDPAKGTIRWSVEAPAFGERMRVGGVTRVEATPDGCRRTIDGDVTVNVRFVGGQIEKYVAEDVQKSYDKAARALAAFILSRK